MNNGKKVLVSDIDGTIIWLSLLPSMHDSMSKYRAYLIFFLPIFPLAYFFYLLRPRKKSAKIKIRQHRKDGGRVVIFSATENMFLTRWVIKTWLKLWCVPYDRLVLRPHSRLIKDFKLEILREENCDILFENECDIVLYLRDQRERDGICDISISYENRFFIVRFNNFQFIKEQEVVELQ